MLHLSVPDRAERLLCRRSLHCHRIKPEITMPRIPIGNKSWWVQPAIPSLLLLCRSGLGHELIDIPARLPTSIRTGHVSYPISPQLMISRHHSSIDLGGTRPPLYRVRRWSWRVGFNDHIVYLVLYGENRTKGGWTRYGFTSAPCA